MDTSTKIAYWILGIVAAAMLAGGIIGFYKIFGGQSPADSTTPLDTNTGQGGNFTTDVTQQPGTPVTQGEQGITVSTQGGGSILVKDFKNDAATKPDPNNQGQYYLSGGLDPTAASTAYSTFFVEANQSFNITLLREPIKDVRIQAETELLQKLGITQEQACALNYYVGVPAEINEIYAGKNLGFSFCNGATSL
jgi:hypothetical protein